MGPVVDVLDDVVTTVVTGMGNFSFTNFSFGDIFIGAALSLVSMALTPKPKMPSFDVSSFQTTEQDRQRSFRQPITTRKLAYGEVKAGGPLINVAATNSDGKDNNLLHMFQAHAAHEIDSIISWWINGTEVPISELSGGADGGNVNAGEYNGVVTINPHKGATTQSADPDAVSLLDGWTEAHTVSGVFYNYWRFTFDNDVFHGIPNVACKFKGKKILDVRTGTTAYSANAALVLYDYLTDSLGLNVAAGVIDTDSFITAANVCDEDVTLAEGGTEKRYEAHGLIDTVTTPGRNIEDILTAMSGSLIYTNGKFFLFAGATKTSTLSFTDDDIISDLNILPRMSRRENFNAVKGQYISSLNNYQPSDYPAITSSTFEAQDNGVRTFYDFDLPFTTSPSAAQRIAKIALFRNRQPLAFEATFSLGMLPLIPGDIFEITLDKYGWSSKKFEIIEWSFVIDKLTLGCNVKAKEYSDAVYSFSTSEQQIVDSAPNTTIPNVFDLQPPTNLVASESLISTRDGRGVQSVLTITYTPAADAFAYFYEMEYKKTTSSTYLNGGMTTGVSFDIEDTAPGTYDVRIRGVSLIGTRSEFVSIQPEVSGLLAAPTAMANLSIQQVGGMALLQWDLSTDLDVRVGGKVEIRHQNVTSSGSWPGSLLVDDSTPGIATTALVPLRAGTFLCKFIDSSGVKQSSPTAVVTDGATILAFSTQSTVTESTAFAGTKTNLLVDANKLQLSGTGLLDDQSDFDLIANFDLMGGLASSGTYDFATNMDLSTKKRVRLTANLTAASIIALDEFDSRTGNIDSWDDFDGTAGAQPANIEMYYASTDDDPSGSPSFSAYKKFTQIEEHARAFKFRAILTTSDPAYNIQCSAMSVVSAII